MVLEDTTEHTGHSHTAGRLTLHYLAGVPKGSLTLPLNEMNLRPTG